MRSTRASVTDAVLLPLYPDDDLDGARHRLTLFLAQYWGGPTTYMDERGHPMLRMRHMPFQVGPAERDHWLLHMAAAVERCTATRRDPRHADGLLRARRRAHAQRRQPEHRQALTDGSGGVLSAVMPDVASGNGRGNSERLVALVVRRAATGLKIAAGVLAVGALVQGYLAATIDMNEIYNPGFDNPSLPFKLQLQGFLQNSLSSLTWVALVVAAAYGLQIAAVMLVRRVEAEAVSEATEPEDLFTASPSAVLSTPSAPPASLGAHSGAHT